MAEKKQTGRKIMKIALVILLCIVIVIAAYIAYVLIDYHRIEDNQVLSPAPGAFPGRKAKIGADYSIISYNIGFAAYTPDFGFFMDGGTESRAFSKESVLSTMDGIVSYIKGQNADFYMLEEVDTDATRSHHVDERDIILENMPSYSSVFAVNYDSPYLFYPIFEPHGKSVAGLLTLSKFDINGSVRRSLPIEDSLMKLVDLDRCYTVSRIDTDDGHELVLFTIHLSAYTSDGTIATEQLKMLISQMREEYGKGNYVVCGGDFNKDLLSDSAALFGVSGDEYTWAQPFPEELLEGSGISLIAPYSAQNPVPSCRNADGPYTDDQYVLTVDGFMVSDNVEVLQSQVLDTGFAYSDHNPVKMTFRLIG